MNPTATQRFRRITAALAVVWALFGLLLQISSLLFRSGEPHLPIAPSVVGGIAVVQWRSAAAAAMGVEVGDRLLSVDGRPFSVGVRRGQLSLELGRENRYWLESRSGHRFVVLLPPELPTEATRPVLQLLQLALLAVGCVYLVVGVGVWRLRPDRAEAWALLLFCSLVAAQIFSSWRLNSSGLLSLRSLVNLPLVGATFFHLFTTYPIEPPWLVRRRRIRSLPYAAAAALILLVLLDEPLGLPPAFIDVLPSTFTESLALASIGILLVERRRLGQGPLRGRADVMLFGAIASVLPIMLLLLAHLLLGASFPFHLAFLACGVFPLAVGYGIVRKQLFDIRLLARSSFVYGAATLAITGLYAFLITTAESVVNLLRLDTRSPWFSVTFLFFAVLAFNPLRDRLQSLVDRFFDRDHAAYRDAVREISEAMVSTLSTHEVVDRMLLALTETMGVERAAVLLFDPDHRMLRPVALRGEWEEEASELRVSAEHPIWTQLSERRMELSRLDFDDETDVEKREICRDLFDTMEIELLVPIFFSAELLGALAVGRKLTGERLVAEDRELLRTLANQSAIAIENSKAYDEIAELNATLETRVEERTRELRETQEQLVQSEKMASLGQLVAGVAHELNNPIGFVHANLKLLDEYICKLVSAQQDGGDTERLRQAIEKLLARSREGTQRVKQIVLDLRTFSRMDQAELQEVDLHQEIDRTLSLMDPRIKDGIRVVKDYETLPRVRCYVGQLNQVFLNLLMNACDALGRRGTIRIETRAEAGGVVLRFSDDGPGIPAEIQRRIFDPFFTTKPVGQGTGLGLSLSHGIVERHGGHINVASEVGRGTTFSVHLPLDATPQVA